MGTTASQLEKDLLSEYQELTFLTKQEILLAHKRFSELLSKEDRTLHNPRVPMVKIISLPELKSNPFKKRICHVFSTSDTKDGSLTFEDFLDLLSAFSDSATLEIKSHYAFRIFDFDDDGTLDSGDLEKLVNCLTGETDDTRLTPEEMRQLISNILEESDIDKDGTVNLSEFQHVISRSPDFVSSFKIVL
ncbi:calcium and integrin-binding protein 1 [Esox lucius]|uniref:Calcium and integrin-binding protein 1 n=1 Tax=Esox lucius TaxID=8010 RepID=C1BYG7_ESOLU|nr:calcium and integrin-binding protein 1 [Esox lucius]ACO14070.1 Calcium and integrin-binding protein 1 [Esox lucius]